MPTNDITATEPELIAFEETRGMQAAEILAAIKTRPGSPRPRLASGGVEVRGCTGTLVIGQDRIPIRDLDLILPWPLQV